MWKLKVYCFITLYAQMKHQLNELDIIVQKDTSLKRSLKICVHKPSISSQCILLYFSEHGNSYLIEIKYFFCDFCYHIKVDGGYWRM